MAVVHPVAGSFGLYAERYFSRWAGFSVRATYGLIQIIAVGAEVAAVAIYFAFLFPTIPPWFWVMVVSSGLVTVNALQVGKFGEFEYWFALIKVIAIIVFIVLGIALILGLGHAPSIGLANLTAQAGFFRTGWLGSWLGLRLPTTSYMGMEGIEVTAAEGQQPGTAVPRRWRRIVSRLSVL